MASMRSRIRSAVFLSTLARSHDDNFIQAGIALEASWWVHDPTESIDYRDGSLFMDTDPVPAVRVVSKIDHADVNDPARPRAPDHRLAKRRLNNPRKQRHDLYAHAGRR